MLKFLILILLPFACYCDDTFNAFLISNSLSYNDFHENPYTTKKEKEKSAPYLLPIDHPAKLILDSIFLHQRATLNEETFAAAGFISLYVRPRSFIHVACHPALQGYLLKIYLDSELRLKRETPGWKWFVNRAKNARVIDKFIKKEKIQHFTVAKKWIYPLPIHPSPPVDANYVRKNEILLVEDMGLVSKEENLLAWKTLITKKHLHELYAIISHAGGSSYRAGNIAYTTSGKFAFIDTEYSSQKTDYKSIVPYLSSEMAAYWKKITGITDAEL